MYKSVEYSDDYLKTCGSLWKYYRDEISTLSDDSDSASFKYKQKIQTSHTGDNGRKDVQIIVPIKYFSKSMENSWNAIN